MLHPSFYILTVKTDKSNFFRYVFCVKMMNMEELKGIKKNVLLKDHTTFRIGGPAKYFFVAETKEELIRAISWAKENSIPFFILGGGSNTLVRDEGYEGIVIKIQMSNIKCQIKSKIQISNCFVTAGAGASLARLVSEAAKNGLTGIEWVAGVPGTVGGAIRGNAGAFGGCMADNVKTVEVLKISNSKIETVILNKKECGFSYRDSLFKHNGNLIILSAEIELRKGSKEEIEKQAKKTEEHLEHRRNFQPLIYPSAGSIFKNPTAGPPKFSQSEKLWRAGALIERCGLKGKTIGQAQISEKHANFIINLGGAEAKDVIALIDLVKKEVKEKFNIVLEEEVVML